MWSHLVGGFIKNAIKGVIGVICGALLFMVSNYHPTGDIATLWFWNNVIVVAITGLVGLLMRIPSIPKS